MDNNIVREVDWKRTRIRRFHSIIRVTGVTEYIKNYGSCTRASYGCMLPAPLESRCHRRLFSDSDFVASILEHPVALPKFIRMHVAF